MILPWNYQDSRRWNPENIGKYQNIRCTLKAYVLTQTLYTFSLRNEMLNREVYLAIFFHNHDVITE